MAAVTPSGKSTVCIGLSLSLFVEFINGFHDTANAVAAARIGDTQRRAAALWALIGQQFEGGRGTHATVC